NGRVIRATALKARARRPFQALGMTQQAFHHTDERLNAVTDRDELWGPLLSFRPEKRCCFSAARVLGIATVAGSVYGLLLNLALGIICRLCGHHAPPLLGVPMVLTFTY